MLPPPFSLGSLPATADNIAYELEGACTSIVAQNAQGQPFHARNLDFGLFLGWDNKTDTWQLAEKLRPLLFNAQFVKGGNVMFNGTYYAGFVGLLTGMKTGGFSITVDTRFDLHLDKGLFNWLEGDHSGHFLAFTTRTVMETATSCVPSPPSPVRMALPCAASL